MRYGAATMSAAIPAKPIVRRPAKTPKRTPETHKRPAKMKAKTEAVPKSRPNKIRIMQSAKAGAIKVMTLVCTAPLRSRLASMNPAHKIIKNLAISLGCTSTKPRLIQLRLPLTLLPITCTATNSAIEMRTPERAIIFQRASESRDNAHAIGIEIIRKIICRRAIAYVAPLDSRE